MTRYPKNSEHDLLWHEIQWQYFADLNETDRLREDIAIALQANDFQTACNLEDIVLAKHFEIHEARQRREEILYRLWLDSELRKEGKTYPDVYERDRQAVCSGVF